MYCSLASALSPIALQQPGTHNYRRTSVIQKGEKKLIYKHQRHRTKQNTNTNTNISFRASATRPYNRNSNVGTGNKT